MIKYRKIFFCWLRKAKFEDVIKIKEQNASMVLNFFDLPDIL